MFPTARICFPGLPHLYYTLCPYFGSGGFRKHPVHKTIITSGKACKDEPITGHNETTDESSLVEYYNVLGLSFRYETVKNLGPALVHADLLFHLPQYVKQKVGNILGQCVML